MRSSSWLTSLIRPGLVLIVLAPSSVSVLNITNVATVLPSLWKNSASTARYWHGHLYYRASAVFCAIPSDLLLYEMSTHLLAQRRKLCNLRAVNICQPLESDDALPFVSVHHSASSGLCSRSHTRSGTSASVGE